MGKERSVAIAGVLTVNSVAAYIAAAAAGFGIVQVPEVGVLDRLRTKAFVEVLSEWRPSPLPATLLYAQGRHVAARVRVFMDWLVSHLQPLLML